MLSRMICRDLVWLGACAASLLVCASAGGAPILVTTGHTGAQVQDDVDHTQHWTFSVTSDVSDVAGGLFTMKDGPHTSENIEFDIYEGTYGNPLGSDLLSAILGPSSFTQSYAPVQFIGGVPITLLSGHTYTAVLWSNAADSQSNAYFIKGGSDSLLSFTDPNGSPVPAPAPVPGVATGVPLPVGAPAAAIAIAAGMIFRAVRRKAA
jgi:hypothetical protein